MLHSIICDPDYFSCLERVRESLKGGADSETLPFAEDYSRLFSQERLPSNMGNLNHFLNVVSMMAHLINYFEIEQGKRSLTLMLAAYYHDIGKTVINHRHAMEGGFIFKNIKASGLIKLERLYASHGVTFTHEDLLYISALIERHDLFGTLSNGENSYYPLHAIPRAFPLTSHI